MLNVPCHMIPYNLLSLNLSTPLPISNARSFRKGTKKGADGTIRLLEQGSFTKKMGVNLKITGNNCSDGI
jgi:hypothetical protein